MIRIRELRIERNMTQLELAMELDIGNTTLQQYETGLHEPNFDMLIDYLIGRTPIRRPLDTAEEKLAFQLKNLHNQKAIDAAIALLEEVRDYGTAEK